MVWFKIDDGFWSHPKVLELSDGALALWTRAGSYCAGHLTDGEVKRSTLRVLGADHDAAVELVMAGLWDETPAGWTFHDWAEYQPTREQVLAERAAAAERKRKSRESRRASSQPSQGESRRDVRGVDAVIPASPTRPDPTRPDPSTSDEVEEGDARGSALPSPFCSKHPDGTEAPCRACGNARMAYDLAVAAEKTRPTPLPRRPKTCAVHAEYPLPCDRCAEDARAAS